MMNIGICGRGTVGNALGLALSRRPFGENAFISDVRCHDVFYWDIDPAKQTVDCERDLLLGKLDLIFICLPTPQVKDSLRCDTSVLDQFFSSIGESLSNRHFGLNNFVIKSTVPVGYTKATSDKYNLPNLCHSPEFLTARTAVEDANNPTRNIIGIPQVNSRGSGLGDSVVSPNLCHNRLIDLYTSRWPNVPIFNMTSNESEAVKLIQNSFSAMKISFFNEMHAYATKMGMDWDRVMSALLAGGWINPMHTQVPGRDGFGFSGACLPKDIANLISCQSDAKELPCITSAALFRNAKDRSR